MESIYPTKEEILANPPANIAEDIRILCDWKDENYKGWKDKSIDTKILQLEYLLTLLAKHYGHPCIIRTKEENCYDPNTQTIYLSLTKPSIISTLHEFGHHLNGASELKACSYSVWMYKIVFPKMFKKMVFDGHLVKTK